MRMRRDMNLQNAVIRCRRMFTTTSTTITVMPE